MDVSIIFGCQNDFHMDLETDLLWENVWDPHRSSVFVNDFHITSV